MNKKPEKLSWPRRPGAGHGLFTILAVVLLLTGLAIASPSFAEAASTDQRDTLVDDVVRMLDAGIESDLIVNWLKSGDRRAAALSANDLIALKQAKASRELIEFLLAMTARAATAVTMPEAATNTEAPAGAYPEPDVTNEACCLVDFAIQYRATEDREGEQFEQPGRDLFLYMDGEFLARLESQGNIASRGPERFKSSVAPGEHTLRLMRQLHTRKRSDSWDHETTVSPSSIRFRIEPGARWQLELSWVQSEFSTRKPLTWRWLKDGTEVAGEAKGGQFRDDWAFLCEDAELSRDVGAIARWRANDRLKDCVNWASLWPAGTETDRGKVLAELSRSDYEPPVR